jgi:hypothetical protein
MIGAQKRFPTAARRYADKVLPKRDFFCSAKQGSFLGSGFISCARSCVLKFVVA